jgi:uncharacterized protein YbjT (DUF2867 family)
MRIRNICILGGTGFVGHHLASELTRHGYQIKVLTRHRERHRDLLVLPTLELVESDIQSSQGLHTALRGSDAVINLVGILHEGPRSGAKFHSLHVELPLKIAEACRVNRIPRLLHMSALNASADGPSQYLRSKGEGEQALHERGGDGLAITTFRPSVIFGPGDGLFDRFAGLLAHIPFVFPLACPQARFAPVYVGDVVLSFVRSLADPSTYGKRYDLCGPREYTLQQLVEYTRQVLDLRRIIMPLNDRLSKLQARLLEHFPGALFTQDNYLSMQMASVCRENGLVGLGITPTGIAAVVPKYLIRRHGKGPYPRP